MMSRSPLRVPSASVELAPTPRGISAGEGRRGGGAEGTDGEEKTRKTHTEVARGEFVLEPHLGWISEAIRLLLFSCVFGGLAVPAICILLLAQDVS